MGNKRRRIISKFVWGGKKGIGWNIMEKSKEVGGMGLRAPKFLVRNSMV